MSEKENDNKKEKDIAISMFQNEHNRWNQWTIFFFGFLAAIFVFYYQIDHYDQRDPIPLWIFCYFSCLICFFWVMVSLSIRESTYAWLRTIHALENNDTKSAFKLFEEKKRSFSRQSDFVTTMKIWTAEPYKRITRMLTLMGVLLFLFFFITGTIYIFKYTGPVPVILY